MSRIKFVVTIKKVLDYVPKDLQLRIVPDPKLGKPAFIVEREALLRNVPEKDAEIIRAMKQGDTILLEDMQGNEYCIVAPQTSPNLFQLEGAEMRGESFTLDVVNEICAAESLMERLTGHRFHITMESLEEPDGCRRESRSM